RPFIPSPASEKLAQTHFCQITLRVGAPRKRQRPGKMSASSAREVGRNQQLLIEQPRETTTFDQDGPIREPASGTIAMRVISNSSRANCTNSKSIVCMDTFVSAED